MPAWDIFAKFCNLGRRTIRVSVFHSNYTYVLLTDQMNMRTALNPILFVQAKIPYKSVRVISLFPNMQSNLSSPMK